MGMPEETMLRKSVRIGFGVLLLVIFGLALLSHAGALLTGGLTTTDLWELPLTLSVSLGLILCGWGLLTRRATTAWAAPGVGLGLGGLYIAALCVLFCCNPRSFPLTGSMVVNGIIGIVMLAAGFALLWRAYRRPNASDGGAQEATLTP